MTTGDRVAAVLTGVALGIGVLLILSALHAVLVTPVMEVIP